LEITFALIMQTVANGLSLGGIYITIALGLTLLLSIMRILQLAHGEIYMLGAYAVYYLCVTYGFNLYFSIVVSMIVLALFGLALERVLFRPCSSEWLSTIVVSIGLTLILQNAAVKIFGLYERSIPRLAEGSLAVLGIAIPKDRLVALLIAAVLSILLYLFLKKTRFGQAMTASSQNPEGARLRGINPVFMSKLAMMIACGLAAGGGALGGSILMLTPFMGTTPLMKGLTIIVIGGMGSLFGAIIGGLLLGLIDAIFPVMFGPLVASIVPLVIVVVIILVKPQGLFGHE
jgi:branched-chain amino acid transport system permease protein